MYINKYNFGKRPLIWNPWYGCSKVSEACENCYIKPEYTFQDCYYPFKVNYERVEKGSVIVVGLKSDFFLAEADKYRDKAWQDIRNHPDLIFLIITKRITRAANCLPQDWGEGYNNVIFAVTAENQKRADERIPSLLELKAKHKWIACSPLLEEIDLTTYLSTGQIEHVETLGEKGFVFPARPVYYKWWENLCDQCKQHGVRFSILYVGHNCIMPDNSVISDNCTCYHSELADSLNLYNYKPITFKLQNLEITY